MITMFQKLKKIFIIPHFEDEEKNRIARIIHVILLSSMGILLILFITTIIADWFYSRLIILCTFIIFIITLYINSKGYTKAATFIVLTTALIASIISIIIGAGIHDSAIVLFPAIIIVASLMLNKRIFIIFVSFSIIFISVIALAEIYGYFIPNMIEQTDTGYDLITILVILIIEAIAIRLLTEDLIKSLFRARKNEEDYKQIFNNIQDIYFEVDFDNILLEISPSIERLSLFKRDELINNPIPLDVVNNPEFFKIIRENGSITNYEMDLRDKDGANYNVAVNAILVKGSNNENEKIVGSIRDITEVKKLENQLLQSQKMESIGILAGGISHDFNNLLTVILGHSDILLRTFKDPSVAKQIEEIHIAGKKAANLTRQLLAFSRKQIYNPEIIDLNKLVGNIKNMILRLIEEDITLEIDNESKIPNIEADPGQIEQIIINLIVNARDAINLKNYKQHKIKQIRIETKLVEIDKNYVKDHLDSRERSFVSLSICDNGIGIDKEIISHIFEPFYTTKSEGKGTGLGLSTVYGIVKQNKGFLNVESKPDTGTTFEIFWPVSKKEYISDSEELQHHLDLHGKESILLVEDNPQVLEFAYNTIKHYNYNVYSAVDGADALDKIKKIEEPVNLLITDVVMPNINGKDLAEKLIKLYPNMKILFVSGYANNQITKDGEIEVGINLLNKPFSTIDLMKKIKQTLDKP